MKMKKSEMLCAAMAGESEEENKIEEASKKMSRSIREALYHGLNK